MKAYIVTSFIGCFALDESNEFIDSILFEKNPSLVAEKIKLAENELIEEENVLKDRLVKKGFEEIVFNFQKKGEKFEKNSKIEKFFKENFRKISLDSKFVKSQNELNKFLTDVNIELTKEKIKKSIGRDSIVIQVNGAIEELDKSTNIFVERLREWYGLHFPEMERMVEDHEKFLKLIEKYGSRDKFEEFKDLKEKSMGMDLTEEDVEVLRELSGRILELYKIRESLGKYLEKLLKEIAPNFTEIVGPVLTAKFIATAGGMERLAKMPSSTIQLLGAEKSLFRHLHGKGRSPRFGILFSHPLIQKSPDENRGKIARLIASKLSIAAKVDFYSKKYKSDEMKRELERRVKDILSEKK